MGDRDDRGLVTAACTDPREVRVERVGWTASMVGRLAELEGVTPIALLQRPMRLTTDLVRIDDHRLQAWPRELPGHEEGARLPLRRLHPHLLLPAIFS